MTARVLVAEDDPSLRTLVEVILGEAGFEVVTAADGRFAKRALAEQGPFDVLVLDLMMPFSDGFDVLRSLDADRPKVLVLSARADPYGMNETLDLGIDAYLTKPYDPDDLVAVVTELLGR